MLPVFKNLRFLFKKENEITDKTLFIDCSVIKDLFSPLNVSREVSSINQGLYTEKQTLNALKKDVISQSATSSKRYELFFEKLSSIIDAYNDDPKAQAIKLNCDDVRFIRNNLSILDKTALKIKLDKFCDRVLTPKQKEPSRGVTLPHLRR